MENIRHFFEVVNTNATVVYVLGNDYYINPVAGGVKVTREEALKGSAPVVEETQNISRRKKDK